MIDPKQAGALVAIALGGFINAGIGAQVGAGAAGEADPVVARQATDIPAQPVMQRAAEQALRSQLRADLADPGVSLRLGQLHFERASGRTVEARGDALASFDGDAPVPLEVSIAFDLPTQSVEQVSYLVSGPAPTLAIDVAMRTRIADRIGSRLVVEFSGQPVDFALSRIEHLSAGRERLLVSGDGIASFAGEGAARTRFVATADRASGKLLTLQYELGEQLAQ